MSPYESVNNAASWMPPHMRPDQMERRRKALRLSVKDLARSACLDAVNVRRVLSGKNPNAYQKTLASMHIALAAEERRLSAHLASLPFLDEGRAAE